MEHAHKMYLVPRQQVEHLSPSNTDVWDIRKNETHRLDAEIKAILNRTDLKPHDKAGLYSGALQNFLQYYKQLTSEKTKLTLYTPDAEQPPGPSTHAHDIGPTPTTDAFVLDLLKNISQKYRGAAQMLLSKMSTTKDLTTWNARGEFVYKGQPVAGSHMYDLVRGLTHGKTLTTREAPRGWEQFLNAAAELNIPSTIIGNAENRRKLESLKDPAPAIFTRSPAISTSPFFPQLTPARDRADLPMGPKKRLFKMNTWLPI
ncbi:hypothetical protein NDU88_000580 [Pleurodeles waltl]|uniref:Uncharacterized protein n=1 Tax=Pleurodeles waltl TaxID=8319 RepID=A0AAV7US46_PLEWA|nr:hypothetical protein NDU88_000580 [Pleurodeles waltl]